MNFKTNVKTGLVNILLITCLMFMSAYPCIAASIGSEFAGSSTCRDCHSDLYYGWKSTMHPYKFLDASPETIKGDFTDNNTIGEGETQTRMSREGDSFYISTVGPDGERRLYPVLYLIGQFWRQHYVTEFKNGALHILPAMWNMKTKKWSDYKGIASQTPGSGKFWGDSNLTYQDKCTGCHNTESSINYDATTDTYDTEWAEKGISCEACHGPGKAHSLASKDEKIDTIINPSRIPDPDLAVMVCGRCHIRGTSPDSKYAYPMGYEIGDHLDFLFVEGPKLHDNDTSAANRQQYIDWKKSGHAREGVKCWDCHTVHEQGKANRAMTKLPGSSLCLSCHEVNNTGVHGIHSVNNCVGCHMPATGKRAVQGDVHSHQFKVLYPSVNADTGKAEMNSCSLCHYHEVDSVLELKEALQNSKN